MRPLHPGHVPKKTGVILRKDARRAQEAETLAGAFLAYLADEPDRMMRFFDLTGLTPQGLREAAARPGFTESVLEYLGSDDRLLLTFAAATKREPADIDDVRRSVLSSKSSSG